MKKMILGLALMSSISAFAETVILKNCESQINAETFENKESTKKILLRSGVYCRTNIQQCQQRAQQRQIKQPQSAGQDAITVEVNEIRTIGEGEVARFNGLLYSCEN